MQEWLAGLVGDQYVDAVLWTSAALVALLVLLGLVKIFRSLNSGTFVAGGRNRKTRLAVMDATAVDSQRRLVLIRRDDVEHLLLIGGPTDVVVEQDIRLMGARRPNGSEAQRQDAPRFEAQRPEGQRLSPESEDFADIAPPPAPPRAAQAPARPMPELSHPNVRPSERQPIPPRPAPPVARPAPDRNASPEPRTPPPPLRTPAPAPRAPVAAAVPTPTVRPAPRPALSNGPAPSNGPALSNGLTRRDAPADSIEDSLLSELDLTDDLAADQPARPKAESSLDDEMARLLGELANPRR